MSLGRGDANGANARKTLPNRVIVTGPAHAETLEYLATRDGKPFVQAPQLRTVSAGHAPRESVTTLPPFDTWQPKRRKPRRKPMPVYPKHAWSS
jgi:hypothetical protein